MFLMQQTKPSYEFLSQRVGINDAERLKNAIKDKLSTIDLAVKKRDFEHLLFNPRSAERILQFAEFVDANL
mgnify:FL=1